MLIYQFQKETSERSEMHNWVLSELSASKLYYYAGFEGCNENLDNTCTAILDRASIEVSGNLDDLPSIESVRNVVSELEGVSLSGKINFCNRLGIPFTYILYNYDNEFVLRYEFSLKGTVFRERYNSFQAFSEWIQSIKQWTSGKKYREIADLPEFDKALRRSGCPWPTNIDCVAFSINHTPLAIIEFQNAKTTGVLWHNNNSFFLPYWDSYSKSYKRGRDEQRWRSQDILRLQSELPHLTIVWSQKEDSAIVKLLDTVAFPDYGANNVEKVYMKSLNDYRISIEKNPRERKNDLYHSIRSRFRTYHLNFNDGHMGTIVNEPPLSFEEKTFPFLYGKRYPASQKGQFRLFFEGILSSFITT